jgi:hypothetical protein
MKPVIFATIHPLFHRVFRAAVSGALAIGIGTHAPAQSAGNFDTKPIAPSQAAKPAAAKTPATAPASADEAPTVAIGPSRFVGKADLPAYVQSLTSILSMSNRATDPFGQFQDPEAKPIVKPTVAKVARRTQTQVTPFSEIVERIQVTTIMPGEQRFLIGTRSFKKGDRFPINFRGRATNVEVAAVTASKIEFRSLDNGEVASLKLNMLPVGMTPGTNTITAPGMVPDRPNAPLEIEPMNETSQN